MAVALTPDAFLSRQPDTAWDEFYSACGWVRLDADRAEFTILAYLGNSFVSRGFQWTVDADRQLIVFRLMDFADLLGGVGPTLEVEEWWFWGLTTIGPDVANNIQLYYGRLGDPSLTQVTASFSGTYDYRWHGVGARPDGTASGLPAGDGDDGAFRLHGSVWGWRTWQDTTITPVGMQAEFEATAPPADATGLWSSWPMDDAATAGDDVSGAARDLTATAGAGTITDTDGPFDGGPISQPIAPVTQAAVAQPLGRAKSRTLDPAASATVAQPLARRKQLSLGTVVVPAAAQPLAARKSRQLGTVTAATAANAVGRAKRRTVGPATTATAARPLAGPPEPPTGDVTVKVGPSRVGRLTVGASRTGVAVGSSRVRERVTVGPTRTGMAVGPTRVRERVDVAAARIRKRVEVGPTRLGTVTVAPSRTDRGA